MHCKDCGRTIFQALEKAIAEPAHRAWQAVWMGEETKTWICEVTGNEHVPGEPPFDKEQLLQFAQGQCHAMALAVGDLLTEQGEDVRYLAVWLDARGEEALADVDLTQHYEEGPAPDPMTVEHVMVLRGDEIVDVSGRTPLSTMDMYCFDSVVGWTSHDMPLVRYTVVSREWIEGLATAWRQPDLDAARKVAPLLVALRNLEYA